MIKLQNGAMPLLLADTPNEGVVLAEWGQDNSYVVWHYWRVQETGSIICEWGHYFKRTEKNALVNASTLFSTKAAEFLAAHTQFLTNTGGEHGR